MFDIVGVVADAFRLAFRNFFKIAGYLFAAAFLIGLTVLGLAGTVDPMGMMLAMQGIGLLPIIFVYVVMFCAQMACLSVVAEDATGNPVGFGEGLTRGIAASPMAFIVSLIMGIVFSIVVFIPMMATGGLAMSAGDINSFSGITIIGLVVSMILATTLACIFAPLLSVLVVERAGFVSIKRAMDLTSGHRIRIFLSLVIFVFALIVVTVAWQFFISIIGAMIMSGGSAGAMIGVAIFLGILSFCFGIFTSSVGLGLNGAIYAQLVEIED